MRASDEVYFQVKFKPGGMDFRFVSDKDYFEKFCKRNAGEKGYIIICIGKIEKSVRQLRFFHGPLIDAFIRITGMSDKGLWKEYLKKQFLDRDDPDLVPSLADISMRRMSRFIQRSADHLVDKGGYLDEYEEREYNSVLHVEIEKKQLEEGHE